MIRNFGMATAVAVALFSSTSAYALVADGITYTLTEQDTANALTDRFTLTITGINGPSDTEGGRSGVNAIAFTKPSNFTSATIIPPPTGYVFVDGGLNAAGCDGNGNFYCFDNTAIPPTPSTPFPANSSLTFVFDVTTSTGDFGGYNPDFKIDWVGSQNNYDLVSQGITIGQQCTNCASVPEPASLALLGSALAIFGIMRRRKA